MVLKLPKTALHEVPVPFFTRPLGAPRPRQQVAEIVRYRCDSGSWDDKGRFLSVLSRNLVVSAPLTVQTEIADYLDSFRR